MNQINLKGVFSCQYLGEYKVQEDYFLFDEKRKIFSIADGFGGPAIGEKSSQLVAESIRSFLFKEAGDLEATLPFILRNYYSLSANILFNAFLFANSKLYLENKNKNIQQMGGASLLSFFIDDDFLVLGNVGVCQGFLFRNEKVVPLNFPRKFSTLMDPSKNEADPRFDVPLMALGMYAQLEPEIYEYKIYENDLIVVSTDGIIDSILTEINEIYLKEKDINQFFFEIKKRLDSKTYLENSSLILISL